MVHFPVDLDLGVKEPCRMVVSRIIIILDSVEFAKFHVELAVRSDQQKGSHRSTIFSTVAPVIGKVV